MKNIAIIIAVLSLQNVFSQVNLMDTTNQYDYVIITIPEFVATCEVFAEHKENVRDLKTLVVDTTMILNEFNSNTMIQDNIRDFISYAGTFWKSPQPKYFLFAGNLNVIPNYEHTLIDFTAHSDFKYSQSIYDDDSLSVEFYIGRVPASNIEEVNNYFNKVVKYESDENLYPWNNNSLFFAEYDTSQNFLIQERATSVANLIPGYIDNYFFFENDSSSANPMRDSLLFYLNSIGMSSLWIFSLYFDSAIGYSNFFTIDDIDLLSNANKPFVVFNMSTQLFATDSTVSFNDKFLLSEGGSIAGIASVGLVFYPSIVFQFQMYSSKLYISQTNSLGEVLDQGINGYQKMVMNLWGDPSLKLKYDVTTDVKPISPFPTEYSLEQNYPNPFNPLTTIRFSIPVSGNVELKIYNVLGKEIKILTDRFYNSGNHEVEFDAGALSSGVYFYTIGSGDFHQTRKMILMK